MPVTQLSTAKGQISVSLDGVRFTHRGHPDLEMVAWDDVTGAEIETTRKDRAVLRVRIAGSPAPAHHRDDPHSLKAPRGQSDTARRLAEHINEEVAVRRRWRQQSL